MVTLLTRDLRKTQQFIDRFVTHLDQLKYDLFAFEPSH
jgi:hypothetical protein